MSPIHSESAVGPRRSDSGIGFARLGREGEGRERLKTGTLGVAAAIAVVVMACRSPAPVVKTARLSTPLAGGGGGAAGR